jgi:predicted nucleotidyltransferase
MTMQTDRNQQIAGVGVLEIRRFFRHVVAQHRDAFDRTWLINFLHLSETEATSLLGELFQQGYCTAADTQGQHELTALARNLVRSSAARPVYRKTAESALTGLMSRVREINANPRYLYSVRCVVVFGSFLKQNDRLGDLDVAIQLETRIADPSERPRSALQYAAESGRRFKNFTERLYWAQSEIFQILKNRQRTIRIEPWDSFLGMQKDPEFRYKVVIVDEKEVTNDIVESERVRKKA